MTKITNAELDAEYYHTSDIHIANLEALKDRHYGVMGCPRKFPKEPLISADEYTRLVAEEESRREAEVDALMAQYS